MNYMEQPLGTLAINIPGATQLFREYDIDFCCGGKITLGHALKNKNLDTQKIISALSLLETRKTPQIHDWNTMPLHEMTHYIVKNFHQVHRQQLPELIAMARKVESVHANKDSCPKGLANLFEEIYADLDRHMLKEEEILFPLIENNKGFMAQGPISVMEAEHDEAGEQLETVKKLTHNMTPPPEACNTWKALYNGAATFIHDMMEHILLENTVLFPRALKTKPV
ncbi:iron-sulfur cluster repair protein YtfE [Entomobacter blattae]|nr:iron-sulfur cluster repair protein YtfE [Entomobacter blattae]